MEDVANVGDSEIEITPEMIEAGTNELRRWEPSYDFDGNEAVVRIFNAMLGVAKKAKVLPRES